MLNSSSKASSVCELRTSRCSSWIWKRKINKRSECQHLLDHTKSKRVLEKYLLLLYWLCQSLWLCGSQQTLKNSERDGNTRPPDLPPEKSGGQEATVRTGHGTTECSTLCSTDNRFQTTTWSKQGKEYIKAVYCHPAYLTYMQSISCKVLGWMKH